MAKLKTGRHTSAIKTARQADKHHWANVKAEEQAKDLTKQLLAAVARKDVAASQDLLKKTMAVWARLGHRHTTHPAAASRKIARLSKAVHRLSAAH